MADRITRFTAVTLVAILSLAQSACAGRAQQGEQHPGPRVECPASVSLGECVYGGEKNAEFAIRNSGTEELVLEQFEVSCSCSRLTVRDPGGNVSLARVALPPGTEATVGVTVSFRSRFNSMARSRISFRTNDLATPAVEVEVTATRVMGGLTPLPGAYNAGVVPVGAECKKVVRLVDEAVAPRAVAAVVSSNPARVRATFISAQDSTQPADLVNPGHYLGDIIIAIDTSTPGGVDERVVIHYLDPDPRTEVISVSATVSPKLAVLPGLVVLQPAAAGGNPSYTATLWLRPQGRIDRSTIKLIGSPFARVSVEAGDGPLVPVRLTVDPATLPPAGKGEGKYAVELAAVVDGEECRTTLTVAMDPR